MSNDIYKLNIQHVTYQGNGMEFKRQEMSHGVVKRFAGNDF